MTNTTTKGAGEIPKEIQEWIDENAAKSASSNYSKNHQPYLHTNRIKSYKKGAADLYHHLTTSSPSNSGGKTAEDFEKNDNATYLNVYDILLQYRNNKFVTHECISKLLSATNLLSSQFPQPQLVSGVRTKEEILKEEMKKNKDKAQPAFVWNEDYAGANEKFVREDIVKDAMEEYKNQSSGEHHPTQEIEGEKVYRWVKIESELDLPTDRVKKYKCKYRFDDESHFNFEYCYRDELFEMLSNGLVYKNISYRVEEIPL